MTLPAWLEELERLEKLERDTAPHPERCHFVNDPVGLIATARTHLPALIAGYRVMYEALESIESGAVYADGQAGKTPKTRAREALARVNSLRSSGEEESK